MRPAGSDHDDVWTVGAGPQATTVVLDLAASAAGHGVYVFAHGAGGHRDDRLMLALTELLLGRGLDVVRFNFPYRERGTGRPDPMPRLTECIAEVTRSVREKLPTRRVLLGGRSMGGRAASMLAADGFACDGLVLLGYPLHPAGQPEKLRDAHLARIEVPVLCVNGTRDELCRRDLMERVLAHLRASWTMHWLDGADHAFHVTKATGRNDRQVLDEIGAAYGDWHARTFPTGSRRPPA